MQVKENKAPAKIEDKLYNKQNHSTPFVPVIYLQYHK